ncbi:histidine kinase [Kouleothrix sp.]|uniref:ATP-binding protein n=1 Tax=Kouleothrix sp. TaxID=2779161 RepID=UPI003919852F
MDQAGSPTINPQESRWRLLLRLRWPLGAAITLAFALGQLIEPLLLGEPRSLARLLLDVITWGVLGGLAVWVSLTWVGRREQRYQADLERSLAEQHILNRRLQRANSQLELLSAANRQIAESTSLDQILDAALLFPRRLVVAQAAALLLHDPLGPIVARADGASADDLGRLRASFQPERADAGREPLLLVAPDRPGACLALPLHDGAVLVGRVELYCEQATPLPADELALLATIGSELAEAIVSARRRSREERAIYQLERAIAEERARIARDIHDGLAQALAFQRMRADLWLDWIASDPERLRAELKQLKQSLREQIAELRRAIFALRPVQFDDLGFAGGLNRYIMEFAGQQGWQARADLSGLPTALPPELEATCFRIVQEGLNNIAKHARASQAEVLIDQIDGGLRIRVCDNGRGFEPGQAADGPADRVGLRQMRERLAALHGQLTVLSRPGAGAELRVWMPWRPAPPTKE